MSQQKRDEALRLGALFCTVGVALEFDNRHVLAAVAVLLGWGLIIFGGSRD